MFPEYEYLFVYALSSVFRVCTHFEFHGMHGAQITRPNATGST